jgi:predicted Zn-dependent protease
MSRAIAINLGVAGAAVASDRPALAAGGAALAAKLALELPNSRTAEAEADRIGIELASRAGYDPDAAVTLWQKMGSLNDSRPAQFLSTHPAPENRQKSLAALAPQMETLRPKPPGAMASAHPVQIVRDEQG